jgi:CHAT domain-containing protein/tetratricopeptide (TPR) repeat protein
MLPIALAIFLATTTATAADAPRARTLAQRAIDLTNAWKLDAADAAAREALQLARAGDDRIALARALDAAGVVARLRGNVDEAIAATEEARTNAEAAGDVDTLARVYNDLGRVYADLRFDDAAARAEYERALALAPRVADRTIVVRLLNNFGNLARGGGDFATAISFYTRSGNEAKRAADRYGEITAEHNIGLVYAQQNDPALALMHLRRALALERKAGDSAASARTMLSISEARRALGDTGGAATDLRRARALAAAAGDELTVATVTLREGETHLRARRFSAAATAFDRAIATLETIGAASALPNALTYRARLQLAQKRYAAAIATAGDAAQRADVAGQLDVTAYARTVMGDAYRASGDLVHARSAYVAAVDATERERAQIAGGAESREQYFERAVTPYLALVDIDARGGHPESALDFADRAKGRVLFDVLRGGQRDVTSAMSPVERERDAAMRREIAALARNDGDTARLRAKRDEYATFRASLYAAHPQLHIAAGKPPRFTRADAKDVLPANTDAILELAVTDNAVFLFVVTRDGLRVFEAAAPRARVLELSRRLATEVATRNLAFRDTSRALYDAIIAPAAAALLGRKRLCIIPDQDLWRVPFAALVTDDGRYLAERFAVFHAPSLGVLVEEMKAPPPRTTPRLLAVANTEVPEAFAEVHELQALYGESNSLLLVGAAATEPRVSAAASSANVIHIATHGVFDDARPLESHLVFAPTKNDDGILDAREMMQLRIDADLVVLSACETAAGRPAAGEGMIGMSWALFVAGCPTMLASEWKVESSSTSVLMVAFHRNVMQSRRAPCDALRDAQLEMMRAPRREHPFYWSSFVVLGRGW